MKRKNFIKKWALFVAILSLSAGAFQAGAFGSAFPSLSETTPSQLPSSSVKEDGNGEKNFSLPPPVVKDGRAPESPFYLFRKLIKLSPSECETAVDKFPLKIQKVIREKVEEYKQMPPGQCERQLQILDLRWYLCCGVDLQEDKLDGYIQSVPSDYQEIIRERLERWFSIPESYRTNILEDVKAFVSHPQPRGEGRGRGGEGWRPSGPDGTRGPEWKKMGPEPGFNPNPSLPPPEVEGTNVPPTEPPFGMGRKGDPKWGSRGQGYGGPPAPTGMKPFGPRPGDSKDFNRGPRRGDSFGPFWESREKRTWLEINNFFSMSHEEREKVLNCLPREDRQKTWTVMKMLDELPPVERQNSLKILLQISELPQEERATYLHNAERWKSLSSDEKKFFRILFMPSAPLPDLPPLPKAPANRPTSQEK